MTSLPLGTSVVSSCVLYPLCLVLCVSKNVGNNIKHKKNIKTRKNNQNTPTPLFCACILDLGDGFNVFYTQSQYMYNIFYFLIIVIIRFLFSAIIILFYFESKHAIINIKLVSN